MNLSVNDRGIASIGTPSRYAAALALICLVAQPATCVEPGRPAAALWSPKPADPLFPSTSQKEEYHLDESFRQPSHLRAVQDASAFPPGISPPMKVGCALIVNRVIRISEQDETFTADVDLRLRWRDPRLGFDSRLFGADRYELDGSEAAARLASIWTPEISIENLVDRPLRETFGLLIFSDGSLLYIRRLTAVFETRFDLGAFPFDKQSLMIRLLSTKNSAAKVVFAPGQSDLDLSGVRQGVEVDGWSLGHVSLVSSAFTGWNGDSFARLQAMIEARRETFGHVRLIFVPLLLILFSSLVYLWIDTASHDDQVSAVARSILALIAFNFTVGLRYPRLSADGAVVQTFWIGFAFLWVMLVVAVVVRHPSLSARPSANFLAAELLTFFRWSIPVAAVLTLARTVLIALS